MATNSRVLEVDNVSVDYKRPGSHAGMFRAVEEVSLNIDQGETFGLVGESGSGKTSLGRSIVGLAPVSSGSIRFCGRNLNSFGRKARRRLARDLQMIFQDPYTSLNPSIPVGALLAEPLVAQKIGKRDIARRLSELMDQVSLPADSLERLPREFSGGQRQRVAIARALTLRPKLIVCDEVVSALDVVTQARILELLFEIQRDTSVSYLFISHDLDVVRHISHRIGVMYKGSLIEQGTAADVTERPSQSYTQQLMLASPVLDPDLQRERREKRRRLKEQEAT